MEKEISAGAIVFYKEKDRPLFLLLYKKAREGYKEIYEFPKGNVEENEDPIITTIREVKEETGLNIKILEGFKEKISWFYRREGKTIHKEMLCFLAEAKTKNVKISKEHDAFEWLSFEDAIKKLKFRNQKEILIKANEFLKEKLKQKRLEF